MAPKLPQPNIMLLVSGIGAFLLFLFIAALVFSDTTQGLDAQLALAIYNSNLASSVTQIMSLSSKYGREYFWIPVVAVMVVFGKHGTKVLAVELALLFIVGIIGGDLIKFLAFRPRPFTTVAGIVARIPEGSDSSFPSGHAVIVSIGAIFLLFASFFRAACKGPKVASILLAIEAAVVCYSRVYLGLHYPLDVLGGILLGAAIALAGTFVLELYLQGPLDTFTTSIERLGKSLHLRSLANPFLRLEPTACDP